MFKHCNILYTYNPDKSIAGIIPSTHSSVIWDNILLLEEQEKINNEKEEDIIDEIIVTDINPVNIHLSPNLLTNNVRPNFARMFMNSLNSGDLVNVQNFLNTFMTRSCKVSANHIIHDPALNYPGLVITNGPRQFSHYLMGTFLQYPDMTLNMLDCRIVTHPNWLCTRVEMDLEISCTKMCDLSLDDWIPPIPKLAEKYEEAIQKDQFLASTSFSSTTTAPILHCDDSFTRAAAKVSSASSGTLRGVIGINRGCSTIFPAAIALPTTTTTTATTTTMAAIALPTTTNSTCSEEHLDTSYLSDLTLSSGDESEPNTMLKQRKRTIKPKKLKIPQETGKNNEKPMISTSRKRRPRCDRELTNATIEISRSPSLNDILASGECMGPHIPEVFCRSLFSKATPIAVPLPLQTKGKMVLYLNEHNQLQYINVQVQQTN